MCWSCDNPQGDYLAEVVRPLIAEKGWMVQYVEKSRNTASLAYTIGLTERGLPELVATGLNQDGAARLLNGAAVALEQAGLVPGQHLYVGKLHLEAVSMQVPDAHVFFAYDLYGPALRALQLVWHDDRGQLPWARGFRAGRGGQPVLGARHASRLTPGASASCSGTLER